MDLDFNSIEPVSQSAGLLISILMRYPEVSTVSYNPDDNRMSLSFSFAHYISDEHFAQGKTRLLDCLRALSVLEKKQMSELNFCWTTIGDISVLKVEYDVEEVTKSEIALIIAFLQEEYGDYLMKDLEPGDPAGEEELLLRDEFISYMLESFKGAVPRKKLIAFRDEGKVHVYKK